MKKLLLIVLVLSLITGSFVKGQVTSKDKGLQAITLDAIKGQLEFLSSDWMEGRATGEKGYYLASDYVASMFKVFGVSPAGDAVMGGGFRDQEMQQDLREAIRQLLQNHIFRILHLLKIYLALPPH